MSPDSTQRHGSTQRHWPARVVKRDGREVPFERDKIADAVARALVAVGERDPSFADEVAAVVTLTLEQRYRMDGPSAVPHIEEIQDLVEDALIGMGRAAVAKAYILYRDRRARVRAAVSVETPRDGGPRVVRGERSAEWSKGRIVAALLAEADLPRATSEDVAARVERRVFASGLKRVTTGLVRELVAGELVDMGLTAALQRQSSVGLPRHDLRRLLAGSPLQRWDEDRVGEAAPNVEALVSQEVLRRFALEDIWSEATVERHLTGELSLVEPGRPHLALSASLPADLLLGGEPGPAAAFEVIEPFVEVALGTATGAVLEEPGHALLPLVRATRAGSSTGLATWLRALAAAARGAGRALDLGSPGSRFPSFTARLVEALAAMPRSAYAPRLYLRDLELHELLGAHPTAVGPLEELLRRGRLILTWGRADVRCVGPGTHRRARERASLACGGAVALNLAQAARTAGPWREELLLEQLAGLVQCAVEACRDLDDFQRRHARSRTGSPNARISFVIVPVGLREALRHLGGGEVDLAQGARLVGFLAEAARRFSAGDGPDVVLDAHFGQLVATRLAHLDARRARDEGAEQPWLFADAVEEEIERPYTHGFALGAVPGRPPGAAEAELCRTVPSGAWAPSTTSLGATSGRPDSTPESLTAACERFVTLRPGEDSPASDLLFPFGFVGASRGPRGLVRSGPPLRPLGASPSTSDAPHGGAD